MSVRAVDVARRAGTSTATVSYVLNDGPRPVAEATRLRVLQAARELGYRPNALARGLRTATSGMVGVVVPDVTAPYFAALARDLESLFASAGMLTLLTSTETGHANDVQAIEAFLRAQVDGLVIAYSDHDAPPPETGATPVAYLFNGPPHFTGTVIRADDTGGVRLAMEHFRTHGLHRVAMLAGPRDVGPVGERAQAWRDELGEPDRQPLRSAYSPGAAAAVVEAWRIPDDVPRAVLVASDEQAIGVLAAAHARGIRVPEDMAVISLDGSPMSAFTAPALTVTVQPTLELARNAVAALRGDPHETFVPAHLQVRSSCGC
jgi:LacI family transcriptional regulator